MSFTITELQQRYAAHPQIEAALRLLADDQLKHLFVGGLHGSSASLLASVLVGRAGRPFVFVLGDGEEAGYFYHDLVQVLGDGQVLFFPSSFRRAIKYGQKDAANEILRTEVLSRLQKDSRGLCIVTFPDALAEKVVSRRTAAACASSPFPTRWPRRWCRRVNSRRRRSPSMPASRWT